jgi:peptidoglycan hydrolase CwlO-like protein
MAKTFATPNREILEAALQGLEAQRQRLEEQISQVRSMMGQRAPRSSKGSASEASSETTSTSSRERKRRILSPEARKRIAAAQKKRWATFRKNQG